MNAEISKAILGQTLTTEIGSNGSYAASNTHMGIRQDIIDSDKKLVEQTINQLIQWIYEINFSNAEIPIFELYQEEDVDLTLAQRDKILFDSGVKFTKEYFIKTYGFDEEDIEIKEDGLSVPMSQYSQFAEEPVIKGQKQIDDLFKFLSEVELNKQSQKMIANYKHDERTITYYDMDKTPLPLIYNEYKKSDTPLVSINNFDKMVEITQLLSQNFPFVRVDFYEVNNRILIGEMTFYPGGGYGKYEPVEWDYKLGSWLDLSQIPSEHLDIPDEYSIPIKITNKVLL